MRYSDFKIVETDEPENTDDNGQETDQTVDTELEQPETPEANNPIQGNPALQNALRGLFAGLFGAILGKITNANPQFATMLRTILSGNSNGFNPSNIIGMAPPEMRSQVERAIEHVDPETGNLNIEDNQIVRASAPSGGWTTIQVGDLQVEVGNDYYKQGGVYQRVSAADAESIAEANGWIVPTRDIILAIYNSATLVPMVTGDPSQLDDRAFTERTRQRMSELGISGGFIAGHKKDMFRNERGTIGMIGGYRGNGRFWQGLNSNGLAHANNPSYDDYSQGLRPVKRIAQRNGEDVDLGSTTT